MSADNTNNNINNDQETKEKGKDKVIEGTENKNDASTDAGAKAANLLQNLLAQSKTGVDDDSSDDSDNEDEEVADEDGTSGNSKLQPTVHLGTPSDPLRLKDLIKEKVTIGDLKKTNAGGVPVIYAKIQTPQKHFKIVGKAVEVANNLLNPNIRKTYEKSGYLDVRGTLAPSDTKIALEVSKKFKEVIEEALEGGSSTKQKNQYRYTDPFYDNNGVTTFCIRMFLKQVGDNPSMDIYKSTVILDDNGAQKIVVVKSTVEHLLKYSGDLMITFKPSTYIIANNTCKTVFVAKSVIMTNDAPHKIGGYEVSEASDDKKRFMQQVETIVGNGFSYSELLQLLQAQLEATRIANRFGPQQMRPQQYGQPQQQFRPQQPQQMRPQQNMPQNIQQFRPQQPQQPQQAPQMSYSAPMNNNPQTPPQGPQLRQGVSLVGSNPPGWTGQNNNAQPNDTTTAWNNYIASNMQNAQSQPNQIDTQWTNAAQSFGLFD